MAKYPIPFGPHLLLLERINVGGMAEVFRAKAFGVEGFERFVAVKRILPTLAADQEFVAMFIDEARIAAHLTHQNIVQIYELGQDEGTYYICMEYVAGRDLRLILDRQKRLGRPMDPVASAFVVARVCEALDYAHRKRDPAGRALGIVHRDVTPQNIILSYDGEVKLCDFGIAKAASRISRTEVGVLKGKFAYMAPEQVQGRPTDRRGDIFALGVIFYEMLTGERLFVGDSDYATLEAVRVARVPSPRRLVPGLGKDLEAIVMRMLAREPTHRYGWASDVHDDLLDAVTTTDPPFRSRHLREWMQTAYADAISDERQKMEGFMRLRRAPAPSPGRRATGHPSDPRPSDDFPALPSHVLDALRNKEPRSPSRSTPSANQGTVRGLGQSPVSNLFGTPRVDDRFDEREPAMVRPARSDTASVEREDEDRTVFDRDDPGGEDATVMAEDTEFGAFLDSEGIEETAMGSRATPAVQVLPAAFVAPARTETLDEADAGGLYAAAERPAVGPASGRRMGLSARATGHGSGLRPAPGRGPVAPPALKPAVAGAALGVVALLLVGLVALLRPTTASLDVRSEPIDGVSVFIDGALVGLTPVSVSDLAIGSHRVRLRTPDYREYTQTIQIDAPRPHTMTVSLEPYAGPKRDDQSLE